ncbi:UDP-Glycosyltransferase/glycogen phosphorylase [Earliella scabrosa]|nr:UDP-Glycosyltransferase/glycogen phosphorylase [Earliella scabrosa]
MNSSGTHIVFYATEPWGHIRPLVHLTAHIVKFRPISATLLTTDVFYEKVKAELARNFVEGEEDIAKRIRIVSTGPSDFSSTEEANRNFEKAWKTLLEEGELVCAKVGTRFSSFGKPQAIIIDFFAIDPVNSVKALSADSVKIYCWASGMPSAIPYLCGPEKLGGHGNVRVKVEEMARATGRPYEEAMMPTGKVINTPGMPPMHDHEYFPQDFPIPPDVVVKVMPRLYETLGKADGLLMYTAEAYEPEGVAAIKEWYAETGRKAYITGPLLPAAPKSTASATEQTPSNDLIISFLDETLKASGEKSLVYISFGTIFWPLKTPEKMWAFIGVLMERGIPFILSHASPMAVVPDDIQEKVKAYGKGVLCPWTPQQLILDHPALGWFVTHGGQDSVIESVSAGVPLILWPYGADQPLNAVQVADNLKIGYELLEVRSGAGLLPIYRTGYTPKGTVEAVKAEAHEVLAKAFGEDGAKRRANLEELRRKVNSEWDDGGAAKREIVSLLDSL